MFCSISGNVPEEPVVSSKSGHLFEKRLIEKFVRETGKCPITSEPLTLDDLLTVKNNKTVKPRTAPATSIPGLLGIFHDEWDALMLETHTLRQSLNSVRQELSHALYQHDAACRVIARLIKERDEAREALENAKAIVEAGQAEKRGASGAEEEPAGKRNKVAAIPDAVLQEMTDVNAQLSKSRKKRPIPETLATPEDLQQLQQQLSAPLHKTTQGGILSIDVSPDNASMLATAGNDGTVQLFDYAVQRNYASMEGHGKRVNSVQFASGSVVLSASADKTTRIWKEQEPGNFSCAAVLKDHSADVVGITLHPSRKYFVTASADATWAFYDLDTATCLQQFSDESASEPYTSVQFHPDGLLLGTGTATNKVQMWELRQQKVVASLVEHTKPINAFVFSENGYHLASAADDGVKLWDLRKLKVLRSFTPFEDAGCRSVAFDYSGQYLAVGGADARIYGQKQDWSVVRSFPDMPKKGVMSLRFADNTAKTLLVGAADHNLRVFGMPA